MRFILFCLLISLAACSNGDLASPKGPVFAFNPSQWQPTPGDLIAPKAAP